MKTKSTIFKFIGSLVLALFLWWGSALSVSAQLQDLAFTSSAGAYTEITGGTLIGSAGPGVGADYLDDVTYQDLPIPFSFAFNGNNYSTFNLNTNGFITFGNIYTNSYSPISATTAYTGVIAAIANDLDGRFTTQAMTTAGSTTLTGVLHFGGVIVGKSITGTNIPAGTTITAFDAGAQTITLSQAATVTSAALVTIQIYIGELRIETLGTAPNRIHVIQVKNFKRFGSGSTIYNGEMINFQIRLHETSSNIEFVYGAFTITSATARTSQVGLRGAVNTDFVNRTTAVPHDWSATTAGTLNSATCSFLNTGFPASGLTFLYATPPPPAFGNVAGIVKDAASGEPVIGAQVMTGDLSLVTLADGAYMFEELTEGANTITVHKPGYNTLNTMVYIIGGQTVTQDLMLMESANVPGPVLAELNAGATAVNLSWGLPQGLYEIIYDDGVAENVTAWGLGGNYNALRFTPAGYPVKIMSGAVNIYDGTYPPAGDPLTPFQMAVYDATGPGGYPGTELGVVDVDPDDTGWVSFDLSGLDITISSGDFYLVMIQGGNFPNCAPIAVDQSNPVMRSYSRFVTGGAPWTPAGFNDFMIRAIVQGPGGPEFLSYSTGELIESSRISEGALFLNAPQRTIAEVGMGIFKPIENTGEIDRNVMGYRVYRLVEGEEGNMAAWTLLGNPTGTALVDNSWPGLPDGAYRWAVQAKYPGDVFSEPTFSNVLRKNWASNVTITVSLSDPGVSAAGIQVGLTNTAFPQYAYNGSTNDDGVVNFPEVWKGNYDLVVYKFGYDPHLANLDIMTGTFSHNVYLLETTYPPSALYVDPIMIHATWVAPGVSLDLLEENWGSGGYSANEWTFDPAQGNWQMDASFGNPAPSTRFYWSPSVTNYNNALVSKQLSGLGMPSVMLKYDLYLSNYSSATMEQMAVEVWNGSSWVGVANYSNAGGNIPWTTYTHNITQHAQGQQFKVRFRAYGANSFNINWWNLDNIMVYGEVADGGDRSVLGYFVYLDDVVAGFTEETFFQYQPEYVNYGQTYTAGVQAVYESGISDIITYVFTSQFLYPPCNLEGEDAGHAVALTWDAPGTCDPFGGGGGGGGGGTVQLEEDFEGTAFPPADWAKLNPDGGTGWESINAGTTPLPGWTGGTATAAPDGGSKMAWCTYTTGGATMNDQWLITPLVTVEDGMQLSFYMRCAYAASYDDNVQIKLSTTVQNNPAAFNVTVANVQFTSTSSEDWALYTYTLSDFVSAGSEVYIGFRETIADNFNDGAAIFIDNVYVGPPTVIASAPAGISPVSEGGRDFNFVRSTNGSSGVVESRINGNVPRVEPISTEFMEFSPVQTSYEPVGERVLFDLLGSFPVGDVGGTYSVATDGQFVYSARWNALLFHKYTLAGALIESFSITGAGNVRDLTYDGEFFYGAPNSTTIYKMNFTTQTLAGTITAPAAVRGIAYDATNDGFWITNGWDGPLRLISRTGTTLQTLTTTASSMSGLAWDNVSEGGPYLWAYTQPASNNILVKINLTTGAVIQSFDVATTGVIAAGSISGGLTITNQLIPGKWVFLGCAQNDVIWILELAPDTGGGGGGPVETAGFRIYRDNVMIAEVDGETFEYLDTPLIAGDYNYKVTAIYEYDDDLVESLPEGPTTVTVAPGTGFVQGIVFDAVTFQPVEGVMITAGEFTTTTQANGTYTLVAYEGVYDIEFDKIGYALYVEEDFEVVWQQTHTLNVELTPQDPNFPFEETWTSGSFTTQGWTFTPAQGNWRMSTTAGNPAPSAEFYWSPSVTNYSNALTSVEIDARAALQNVTLTYAILLDNFSATAAEKMTVEIWDGSEWVFVAEHKNDNAIPWTTNNFDVTQHAAGKMTRVRFVANGANSFNINWWNLDNIKLHQVLPPEISVNPTSLTQALTQGTMATQQLTVSNVGDGAMNFTTQIEYLDKSNEFTVYPVEPGEKVVISGLDLSAANAIPGGDAEEPARDEVILNYDGANFDAIGLTAGGTFHVAARYPSSMVGQYAGYALTSVDVYINDVPSSTTLKIWGAGTGTAPGALLHSQAFTSTAMSWKNIELSSSLILDGTDLWVGYEVTHGGGSYPAGCDAGPANPNGDWISMDGTLWEHLAGYGLNYNWNIRARLNPGAGLWLSLSPNSGNVAPGGSLPITVTFDATGLEVREYTANIKVNSNDPLTPQVIVPVTLDVLVGINEVDKEAVMVYPVPASEVLNVATTQGITHMRMFSYTGQVVYERNVTGAGTTSIDVKPYHSGAYILQLITADGQTFNKRILISR
ncbi:MAG: choice-of-anchor J domain-containing protein [Bacteroidales bacterium]|nr:choice-of-anchor J domain-containing protein [Bacteroidales bacterium]